MKNSKLLQKFEVHYKMLCHFHIHRLMVLQIEQKTKIPIDDWQKERTNTEVVVVSHLIEHYNETMNKFVLSQSHDEFAELLRIGFPESSELPKTLLRLESDGVLYNVYLREKACWKIGLKDAFINRMRFI